MAHYGTDRLESGDPTGRRSILNTVHEGMAVYDNADDRIGVVDFVHFGAASDVQQERGTGPASPGPADSPQMREDSFIDNLAEAFSPDEIPDQLRSKLLQEGYVRLDAAGLFAADRFITPDQIASVREDDLHLNVSRDQLIKRR
ncbi:MAG: hypothetical protein IT329_11170 [Caldilineaceae bacterium]|nr:hypothetical protein [Caldilineaceae bacterium]